MRTSRRQQHELEPMILGELFKDADSFLVRQEVETLEAMTGIESANSYIVLGASRGRAQFRLVAVEESGFVSRMFLGNRRP